MELQQFITESLKQIMTGISKAQEDDANTGTINAYNTSMLPIKEIEFDVAVTVNEEQGTNGGIGIFAGAIGVGAKGQSLSSNSSVSRIKFSIPVIFSEQKKR